ncbi:MAG: 3-deoxy-manno-octulosonate-8-phosphatase KdsC [Gammaproteobacteria bacterium]|nr:3-deoxy-manno-octulosonate-8-phosphatase KdsC [Gammaproteobacteria bacterium]MDH5660993.1 3-deoxy-manno-octulosonate-8-phosphatase KdsC [Gammaproteobacteria bacterium]
MKDILDKAAKIKLVVFDVDGVLTDGRLIIGDDGQEYKAFYSKDGLGMKMLKQSGVELAVITARTSNVVLHRMQSLGIKHIYQGQLEKLPAFEKILNELGISAEQAAYVGDDVIDLPVMLKAGLAITVQDAHPLAKQYAHWQTPQCGGRGAARDVCELIMQAQGSLEEQFQKYLGGKL